MLTFHIKGSLLPAVFKMRPSIQRQTEILLRAYKNVAMFMIYHHTRFHVPVWND
jgi:hypothetical protein